MTDTVKKMIPFSKTTWKKIENYSTDMKAKGLDHPSPAGLVEVLSLGAIESACLEKAIEKPMDLAPEGTRAFCQTNPCPNNDGPDTATFVKMLEEKLAETQLLLTSSEQSRMGLMEDYAGLKQTIARLESELNEKSAAFESLDFAKQTIKGLEDEIKSKDEELNRKSTDMDKLQDDVDKAEVESEKRERRIAELETAFEENKTDLALLARWCFDNGAPLHMVQGALFPKGSPEGNDIINKVFTGAVPSMPNECFKWQPPLETIAAILGRGKS